MSIQKFVPKLQNYIIALSKYTCLLSWLSHAWFFPVIILSRHNHAKFVASKCVDTLFVTFDFI